MMIYDFVIAIQLIKTLYRQPDKVQAITAKTTIDLIFFIYLNLK